MNLHKLRSTCRVRYVQVNSCLKIDVCLSVHLSISVRRKTRCYWKFIALISCSTGFGKLYTHHRELEIILVSLSRMVCNTLVAGGRLLQAEQQAMRPRWGRFCESHNRSANGKGTSTNNKFTANEQNNVPTEVNTYCSFKGKSQNQTLLATAIVELRNKSG